MQAHDHSPVIFDIDLGVPLMLADLLNFDALGRVCV